MDLIEIQKKIKEQSLDGWLFYDYHGSNRFARAILEIPDDVVLTRRFFYWIPSSGEPAKIIHSIESSHLDHLPGKKIIYLSWTELEKALSQVLKKNRRIAMEYSPKNAIPSVSVVDAGTIEFVRGLGLEVASSADLLEYFFGCLDDRKIETHFMAAKSLKKTVQNTWELIIEHLRKGQKITEYEVQQFMLSEFTAYDCITRDGPICAVNENSALPHYMASHKNSKIITHGDFILIDLWCKKNRPNAVYADATYVAIAAPEPTPKHQKIFEIVHEAQLQTTEFIRQRLSADRPLLGWEVDHFCRKFIEKKGYGKFFPHRTGHSIDTEVHGSGVNLDSLETQDTRMLLPGACFSIEPGIYLPNEFGIRLEYDLIIDSHYQVQITGDIQESILCLL